MRPLLRSFLRSPGFFAVVVLTLAVGIGANTAIFSVVRGILLRPLPYRDPDRVVSIADRTTRGLGAFSVLEYLDIREQAQRLDGIAAFADGDANLTGGELRERVALGFVVPEFFSYEVSPSDPLAILAAIFLLSLASVVAMWIPVRRALRVDPMVALRDE